MPDGTVTSESPEPATEALAIPSAPVVLYDGTCGLCHKAVKWLLAHEADDALRYAPLQGETATALRARYGEIPVEVDSVVLVEDGRVHLRSKVFLFGARHLVAPYRWAYAFRWFPARVLDVLYDFVASIRYRVFGRADLCTLPSPQQRARFLP